MRSWRPETSLQRTYHRRRGYFVASPWSAALPIPFRSPCLQSKRAIRGWAACEWGGPSHRDQTGGRDGDANASM
ncbi:hypothetical protein VTH06DRAFT_2415 [Thermothelomyces fergusii]